MLKVGAKAPTFRLPSDEGQEIALKDFAGRRVLLFFFPKASTPG
jgi:peroxiredoxin Q/BCP